MSSKVLVENDVSIFEMEDRYTEEKALADKEGFSVVLCGDSISKGVVYDEEKQRYVMLDKSYPNLLQNKLKGVIYNAARFGNTILRATGRLQNDVLKKAPDIVVIEFGGNDCDFNWEEVAQNPLEAHNPNTDFSIFEKSLQNTIELLKKTGIVPVLMTLPPLDADRYFNWISRNSALAGEKILTWLGSISKIYWWQERYNSAIISIAQETHTRWIDIRSAFLKAPDFRQFLCVDGIHPNELGHKLIADKILEYIGNGYRFLLRSDAAFGV